MHNIAHLKKYRQTEGLCSGYAVYFFKKYSGEPKNACICAGVLETFFVGQELEFIVVNWTARKPRASDIHTNISNLQIYTIHVGK